MDEVFPDQKRYLRAERRFVVLFLLFVSLTQAHFVRERWFLYGTAHSEPADGGAPVLYAPDAYRVAMPTLQHLLERLAGSGENNPATMATIAAALDFCFGFAALYLLYRLAVDDVPVAAGAPVRRLATATLFLALIQFPLAWVVPFQRPETMPTAFYLAASLTLLAKVRNAAGTVILLLLTVWQALVRSDAPFVFGVALAVASLRKDLLAALGARALNVTRGAAIVLIAGAIQLYLQVVAFPHLHYTPGTKVVQFSNNLSPHQLSILVMALLPFLLLLALPGIRSQRLSAVDVLSITASALYLPLWLTVGVIHEVRIFVPFLLTLCVVVARVVAASLTEELSHS